mmetsp:Transcript_16459/g.24285  ORF Transcript_16459/g.24285 Transcript_16459/m.24285 type:complete len:251 (-) Transcript_16459:85-837(-)
MILLKLTGLLSLLSIYTLLPNAIAVEVQRQDVGSDDGVRKRDGLDTSKIYPQHSTRTLNSPKGSISLTTLTLDENLNDGNVWLIEFYAPWCGHCQAFANSYEAVAHKVHSNPSPKTKQGRVAKINGDEERATASRFNIIGYPSFFVVDGWSVYEYKGSRTVDALVNYVQGGYKEDSPLPIWSSPMGPIGMIQASMFWVSAKFLTLFDTLQKNYGLSPTLAAMCFAGAGIVLGLFTMIFVAVMLSVKVKEE